MQYLKNGLCSSILDCFGHVSTFPYIIWYNVRPHLYEYSDMWENSSYSITSIKSPILCNIHYIIIIINTHHYMMGYPIRLMLFAIINNASGYKTYYDFMINH